MWTVSVPTRSGRSRPSRVRISACWGSGRLTRRSFSSRPSTRGRTMSPLLIPPSESSTLRAVISRPFALARAIKGAVHRVGEEADEDVSLDAVLGLVEDGANGEVLLERAEGGLGVVELHVHGPQLGFVVPGEVGAKEIGALGMA